MKRREHESEYQRILMERYAPLVKDKLDKTALRALYNDPQEEGYEDDMLEWVKAHPDASFDELLNFDFSHYEPLEIVDGDELDDEDG